MHVNIVHVMDCRMTTFCQNLLWLNLCAVMRVNHTTKPTLFRTLRTWYAVFTLAIRRAHELEGQAQWQHVSSKHGSCNVKTLPDKHWNWTCLLGVLKWNLLNFSTSKTYVEYSNINLTLPSWVDNGTRVVQRMVSEFVNICNPVPQTAGKLVGVSAGSRTRN